MTDTTHHADDDTIEYIFKLEREIAAAEQRAKAAEEDAERFAWAVDNPHETARLLESWGDDCTADEDDFRAAIDAARRKDAA